MLPGDAPLGAGEGLVEEAGDLRGIANMCIPPRGERRFNTNPGMGDSVGIGCSCMCVYVCVCVCLCVCGCVCACMCMFLSTRQVACMCE